MGLRSNPSQRQQRIGYELRKLRDTSGLTAAEAGREAGLSGAHLGHMESGRTHVPTARLRSLLRAYGVENEPLAEALIDMSEASGRGWWSDFKHDVSRNALDLAEMECMASSQGVFDMVYLPGLLQCPEYARTLLSSSGRGTPESTERFLQFRLRRQEVLTGDAPPTYHAIVHEAAFHMDFVDPKVMRQQLAHLMEVARLPHVCIQVLPFKSGGFPAVGTPFTLFRTTPAELSTVYLEHDAGSEFFADRESLGRYKVIFDRLAEVALAPLGPDSEREFSLQRDSFSLLQHLAYTL